MSVEFSKFCQSKELCREVSERGLGSTTIGEFGAFGKCNGRVVWNGGSRRDLCAVLCSRDVSCVVGCAGAQK